MQRHGFPSTILFMKSLGYPLMARSLSKIQCAAVVLEEEEKALTGNCITIRATALPALGINRQLTLTVVQGPQLYQGVGIPDLWMVQGMGNTPTW
jgi:hypothetical protein